MSEIHSLDIPVSKEPEWLFLTLNRWLNNVELIMNDVRNNNNNTKEDADERRIPKKLNKIDFRKEVQWLKKVVETESYPVVFCHNDLQEGNILFRQSKINPAETIDSDLNTLDDLSQSLLISSPSTTEPPSDNLLLVNGNSRKRSLPDNSLDSEVIDSNTSRDDGFSDALADEPELMIIDFEYCAYNYRAFDMANHFLGEFHVQSQLTDTHIHHYFRVDLRLHKRQVPLLLSQKGMLPNGEAGWRLFKCVLKESGSWWSNDFN